MSDVTGGVSNHASSGAHEHRRHDRLLIARHVAGDTAAAGAVPAESAEAESLIERCRECAALAVDLRALTVATSRLPAPARTRDFRITEQQAAALSGRAFDRLVRRLGAPSLGYLRPLAAATMSIGLVLATIGWLPQGLAVPASAPAPEAARDLASGPSILLPLESTATEGQAPGMATDSGVGFGRAGSDFNPYQQEDKAAADKDETSNAPVDPLRALLMIAGLGLAVAGLSAVTLVTVGRRRLDDPLLR